MTNTCYSQYWDFWYATFAFLMNFHGFIRIIRYYVLCMFFGERGSRKHIDTVRGLLGVSKLSCMK